MATYKVRFIEQNLLTVDVEAESVADAIAKANEIHGVDWEHLTVSEDFLGNDGPVAVTAPDGKHYDVGFSLTEPVYE